MLAIFSIPFISHACRYTRTTCLIFVFQLQEFRRSVKVGDNVLSKNKTGDKLYKAIVQMVFEDDSVFLAWSDKSMCNSVQPKSHLFPPVGSSNCVCSV